MGQRIKIAVNPVLSLRSCKCLFLLERKGFRGPLPGRSHSEQDHQEPPALSSSA